MLFPCLEEQRSEPAVGAAVLAVVWEAWLSLSVSMGVVAEREVLFVDRAYYSSKPCVTHGAIAPSHRCPGSRALLGPCVHQAEHSAALPRSKEKPRSYR